MKKRTKITLRTKIYLTIAGLLGLAGILYATNPGSFSSGAPFPTGVAASTTQLLVTQYCDDVINQIDCNGNVSLFANIPGFGSCREKYLTMAPSQSAAAGFTPRDVFVTQGALVYKVHEGITTLFASLAGCIASDHNGITFDHFGTYGFDMIVTCREGNVFRINGTGTATQIAGLFPGGGGQIEGPAVVPPLFGPHGGEIWVADEDNHAVHTIGPPPTYAVTLNVLHHQFAEGVYVIPNPTCAFCSGGAFFTAEQQLFQLVWQYPLSDLGELGGKVILISEQGEDGGDTSVVAFDGLNYVQTSFGPRIPGVNEGSSFADCDVPTPTPTVTPTTCGSSFVIGDLDAVVGNKVTFWGAQWWKKNHLSGGRAPASFKGFANCTNPNPPACGGTWQSDPGNSSQPPDTVPADMAVIVSSSITKSGPIESGDIPMMVTIHTDPGYGPNPGHEGTGTVTAVVCQGARPQQPARPPRPARPR